MKHDTVISNETQYDADYSSDRRHIDGVGSGYSAADIGWLQLRIKKGERGVFAEMADLTPGLAAALLSINEDNRSLKSSKIPAYARDMLNGRWQFNGETISVSVCGFLNDGQNRCHAVIKSGVTIPVMIVFGVDRESRKTTDQGCPKHAGDYVQMGGGSNANSVAAIAAMLIKYEQYGRFSVSSAEGPTKTEVTERAEYDPLIADSFSAINKRNCSRLAPPRLLATCHYICAARDRDSADLFFEKLSSGVDLGARNPIYVAREKLTNPLHRLNINEKAKTIFTAWNHWRKGKQVKSIVHSFKRDESLPEVI